MDYKTEQILTKDSLSESEQIFGGKHWSQFSEFENQFSIMSFMRDNEVKEEYLKSINDTYFGMSWSYFKDLIKEKGFIDGYSYEVKYKGYSKPTTEEIIIWYHPQKGLIIYAESYSNKASVNGGKLYGEIQANSKEDEEVIWKWLSTGGCVDIDNLIWYTSHDIREGLFSKLDTLESVGKFLNRWVKKDRFLYFVDYIESKIENYDYEKITKEKIKKCPKEMREIIGFIE